MKTFNFLATILMLTGVATARADVPATHGMLLFGDGATTYASHLPMFHSPHDYQVIMQISLEDLAQSTAVEAYQALKKKGETFFTIVPEKVDLTQVIQGTKTSLNASLFEGHFEQNGTNLGTVKMHIDKIVFSAKLDGSQAPDATEQYLAFGDGGQYYAAHLIHGKPSFDSILKISQPAKIKVAFCRTRLCGGDDTVTPVPATSAPVVLNGNLNESGASHLPQVNDTLGSVSGPHANVLQVLYLEEDELSH